MANKIGTVEAVVPIGYRFLPNPVILINYYLVNKNLSNLAPPYIMPDIHANKLYSKPPHLLVADKPSTVENEWYFFVHEDDYFRGEKKKEHIVGKDAGFWSSDGEEKPIADASGVNIAFTMCYKYILGSVSDPENKEWSLEKYREPYKRDNALEEKKEGWIIGRIIKGSGYEFTI